MTMPTAPTIVDEPHAGGNPAVPSAAGAGALTVLLASETYLPDANGAAYFVARLAGALAALGHDVHVVCPDAAMPWSGGLAHVAVHRIASRRVPGYAQVRVAAPRSAARQLHDLVGELRPDVVHVQNHFVVGRCATTVAHELGIPVVATNHFLPENFTAFGRHAPTRALRAVERALWWDLGRVYRRAALVTAPTPYAAALTETRARLAGVLPVSCGVVIDTFAPTGRAAAFRAAHDIPERPTMLHVGRLDPDKHVDELIDALALVRAEVDAQLVIVGRGKELDRLRRRAYRHGLRDHVYFCGFVADDALPGAYEAADVYCNAGTAELQSIATMEAMAASKPVVLADAHALPLLVDDGVNGHLFPPGAVENMAARLVALLGDPEGSRAMGRQGRTAVEAHDLDTTARRFEGLYRGAEALATEGTIDGRNELRAPRVQRAPRRLEAGALVTLLGLFAVPIVERSALFDGDEQASYALAVVATACGLSLLVAPTVLRTTAFARGLPAATATVALRAGRLLLMLGLLAALVLLGLSIE